jgi:hypothetical protein
MVGSSAPLEAPAEEPGAAHPGGDRREVGAGCCSTAFPSHDKTPQVETSNSMVAMVYPPATGGQ